MSTSSFADWKGPLIRIGPNELSFYSLEVYRTINSVNTRFAKDPRVYGHFVQDAHPGLFSITFVAPSSPLSTANTNGKLETHMNTLKDAALWGSCSIEVK
jgi:hypothetical protein